MKPAPLKQQLEEEEEEEEEFKPDEEEGWFFPEVLVPNEMCIYSLFLEDQHVKYSYIGQNLQLLIF